MNEAGTIDDRNHSLLEKRQGKEMKRTCIRYNNKSNDSVGENKRDKEEEEDTKNLRELERTSQYRERNQEK